MPCQCGQYCLLGTQEEGDACWHTAGSWEGLLTWYTKLAGLGTRDDIACISRLSCNPLGTLCRSSACCAFPACRLRLVTTAEGSHITEEKPHWL